MKALGFSGIVATFLFASNDLLKFLSNVKIILVSLLIAKFTLPKSTKYNSGIL